MESADLVKSLGKRLNIELELDDDGFCYFGADEFIITISDLPDVGAILLVSDLGEAPPVNLEGLYELMIAAQYRFQGTAGGSFARNPDNDHFEFCRPLAVTLLDPDIFFTVVESFVNTVATWTEIIREYRGGKTFKDNDLPDLSPFKSDNGIIWV